ncbi:hypothetical protein [Prosthecobacter sp.]|uniref:hypothetical protein n=1 Tax=Prosthecobacter sp. TaxID=1965333 RepID=UPI003783614E
MTLWQTVDETFAEQAMADERKVAPMLRVRIRALGQLAKLYLGKKKTSRRKECEQVELATPEEIAELVREWRERQVRQR